MGYSIVEPVPTAAPNRYMHTGRGGAGNMYKPSATKSSASSSAPLRQTNSQKSTASTSSTSSTGYYSSGRGGAGNVRPLNEAAPFSFDEELSMQMTRDQNVSAWHVGRGGAGNFARTQKAPDALGRQMSSDSFASDSSSRSGRILGRISSAFARA